MIPGLVFTPQGVPTSTRIPLFRDPRGAEGTFSILHLRF
jgi:hypothetical protein